jgi:heme exporter protein D
MLPPLASLGGARQALNRLRDQVPLTSDELIAIDGDVAARLVSLRARSTTVGNALTERPIVDRAFDAGVWTAGVGGIFASCMDYYENGGLGFWGWTGLAVGEVGLVLAAVIYQRRRWELDDLADELADIAELRQVLTDILDEVDRRLADV